MRELERELWSLRPAAADAAGRLEDARLREKAARADADVRRRRELTLPFMSTSKQRAELALCSPTSPLSLRRWYRFLHFLRSA